MKNHGLIIKIIAFFTLTVLMLAASGCGRKPDYKSADGVVWNTTYHIVWNGPQSLTDSIFHTLDEVGGILSVFDENSEVCRVNTDSAVRVSPMFIEVYNASRKVNAETGGKFDPTLAPLIQAWGFGKGHQCSADTARIPELLQRVGIRRTHLEGDILVKERPDITFNFSAIAKGYGCDAVARMFDCNGISDYLVEIGGEIRASGVSPRNQAWRVSIDKPSLQPGAPIHDSQSVIAITDCGVATSGNYRNFHSANGSRFGHTLDPTTGRPVATDVISATVIAPTAMEADAYATACMVLGSKGSVRLAKEKNLAIMLILSDSTIYSTESFKSLEK